VKEECPEEVIYFTRGAISITFKSTVSSGPNTTKKCPPKPQRSKRAFPIVRNKN